MRLRGIALTRSRCPHCIKRTELGLCHCSDHCDNHIFISRTEQAKLRREFNKKKAQEMPKTLKDMSRPNIGRQNNE